MARDPASFFEDHAPSGELGRQALRGGAVSVISGYGVVVIQVVAAIVLARLLTPSDFGLVAIITTLTSIAPFLIDLGTGDATIQRARITQAQVSTLFWISSAIGFAIAAILAASSPLIASVYHDPRLEPIAVCSALAFALSGLSTQHVSLLRRTMQFGTLARVQFASALAGIVVASAAAFAGLGYWALVLRPIVSAAWLAAGSWLVCCWRPGRPVFDDEVRSMVGFGMHVVGFSVVYCLARSADRIALGLAYLPSVVGFYQNAILLYEYSIFSMLTQLHNVASAALSKLQSDHLALRQRYESALAVLAFFGMPAAAILSVIAEDLVVVLMGEKWRPSGLLLGIIALRGMFQVIESSQGWLHLSLGRPDRWKNWGIVTAVVQIAAIIVSLPFGPIGVAVANTGAMVLLALPSVHYAGRPAQIGAGLVVRAAGRPLLGAIVTAAAGWVLNKYVLEHLDSISRMVVSTAICGALYLFVVMVVLGVTEPAKLAVRLVRDHIPARRLPTLGG